MDLGDPFNTTYTIFVFLFFIFDFSIYICCFVLFQNLRYHTHTHTRFSHMPLFLFISFLQSFSVCVVCIGCCKSLCKSCFCVLFLLFPSLAGWRWKLGGGEGKGEMRM